MESLYTRAMKRLGERLNDGKITMNDYFDKVLAISVFYKRRAFKSIWH